MTSLYNLYLTVFILFSVLIILSNLTLIGCVLGSATLRSTIPHQLMVSIASVDLLLGCFILPMLIRGLVETEAPICHLHSALQAIGDYGLFFVCGWTFVTMNLIFLVATLCPTWMWSKPPLCFRNAALCLWPWIVSAVFLIPVVLLDTPYEPVHRSHWKDPMCLSNFPKSVQIMLDTLCLYMPLIMCAIVITILIVIFIKRELSLMNVSESPALMEEISTVSSRRNYTDEASSGATAVTNHPLSVCLANLVYFLCYIPVALSSFMTLDFKRGGASTTQASLLVLVPMLTRSVVLPFSWLAMATVRQEASSWMCHIWNSVTRLCCRLSGIPSASVSYTGLREVQSV